MIQAVCRCIPAAVGGKKTAVISDNTQMTLFAANALVWHRFNGGALRDALWLGYREWLGTQGDDSLMDNPDAPKMWLYRIEELHYRRAPSKTCLAAIRTSGGRGTPQAPINNSKGCGTVMRAAPFGLAWRASDETPANITLGCVRRAAIEDAALTHGHPLAHGSSAALALMVFEIVNHRENYERLEGVVEFIMPWIADDRYADLVALIQRALSIAQDTSISDLDGIHALGEGWVAEEALAIALFCAIRHQDDFAAALRAAVNHKGDSDSTGAICGNLLGAWMGWNSIKASMDVKRLEITKTILKIADDLRSCASGVNAIITDVQLCIRYRYGGQPIHPQHILEIAVNDDPADNLSAEAVIMPSPEHFCKVIEWVVDHSRPAMSMGHARVRSETALGPGGRIRIVQVDVPGYKPNRQELLTSCYCAALTVAFAGRDVDRDDHPRTVALPLLGTGDEGWPAHVSAQCLLSGLNLFYGKCYSWMQMHGKVFLCAEKQYLPELRTLLENRSLAFLSMPMMPARYFPDVWRELAFQFMSPRYNALTIDEFATACLERLRQMTGVEPALDSEGYWKPMESVHIPVRYRGWLRLYLPALFQRFAQLWPQAVQGKLKPKYILISNNFHDGYEWMLPDIPMFDQLQDPDSIRATVPTLKPLRETGMLYTPMTIRALDICFKAHQSQTDKSGTPYVFHPFHVAEQLETEDEICAALLHDVVEDGYCSLNALTEKGFCPEVMNALGLLTHRKDEPYMRYILNLRKNPIARRVKLADLRHNLDAGRLNKTDTLFVLHQRLRDQSAARLRKYRIAQAYLEDDEYDPSINGYVKRLPLDEDDFYTLLLRYTYDPASPDSYALIVHDFDHTRHEFTAREGEALRMLLDDKCSLPEALSNYLHENGHTMFDELLKRARLED